MTDEPDLIADLAMDAEERSVAAATDDNLVSRRESRVPSPGARDGDVLLIGRIRAADIRSGILRIWFGQTEHVSLNLTTEQQRFVASALQDRESTLLRIRGRGRYRVLGELVHAHEVEQVDLLDPDLFTPDPNAPTLSEMIERAFADVPDEEWASLPHDLAERHDDYFAEIGDSA